MLQPGIYCFWNCCRRHTFQLVDISECEISMLSTEQLMMVPRNMYSKNEVPEDETGLLFIDGRLARQLESGSYYFWNNMKKNYMPEYRPAYPTDGYFCMRLEAAGRASGNFKYKIAVPYLLTQNYFRARE